MIFQMKAFTLFMAIGLTSPLYSECAIVEGSKYIESCGIGVYCGMMCKVIDKICTHAVTAPLVQMINLNSANVPDS